MTPAYDKALNMIYVAVGNPSPDLDGGVRPGDNLYTDCVVAIDATTGKTKWYYQTVPHDVWDLDAVSSPVQTMLGGKKVVVHAGKTAWVYVLDAATGKLVRRTENFTPQENMFALPTAEGTRMHRAPTVAPSTIAVDPRLGYAFVAGLHQPMNYITHNAWKKGRLAGWAGLRGHPRRGAVGHLHGNQPGDGQDRVAEQGAAADDGRRAGHARPDLHRRGQWQLQRL